MRARNGVVTFRRDGTSVTEMWENERSPEGASTPTGPLGTTHPIPPEGRHP